jgi:predicted DNA-binding transcriptional regulator YafY
MRRADRLFAILQMLRGGRLRRADDIAAALEVSVRTVYRDIADLQAHGTPVDGARGVGYLLRDGHFMPPFALTPDETEALRWGVAFVRAHADGALATAAAELAAKLDRGGTGGVAWLMPTVGAVTPPPVRRSLGLIRTALRQRRKLGIAYDSLGGQATARAVRPLSLEHWGAVWTLTGWCELRGDFRVFRLDRVTACSLTDDRFRDEPGRRLADFLARIAAKAPGAPPI